MLVKSDFFSALIKNTRLRETGDIGILRDISPVIFKNNPRIYYYSTNVKNTTNSHSYTVWLVKTSKR